MQNGEHINDLSHMAYIAYNLGRDRDRVKFSNTILQADSHPYMIFTLLVLLTMQSPTDAAKEVRIRQTTSLKDLKLTRTMLYNMCTQSGRETAKSSLTMFHEVS